MNVFRMAGDASHLLALLVLLYKLLKTKSAAGLSGNTQILYAIVFCTRYNDLLIYYVSLYNTTMKILYISLAFFFSYLIFFRYRKTYERKLDTCRIHYLEVPCILLALLYNEGMTYPQVLWAFSIYLEAVAIIPQMVFISKAGRFEEYVAPYMVLLGFYRFMYLFNWAYRYTVENYKDNISYRSGFIQTAIYIGFLIHYHMNIKDKSEVKHNYSANLPEVLDSEQLLKKEKSDDIPSVFVIGTKESYAYPKQLEQAKA